MDSPQNTGEPVQIPPTPSSTVPPVGLTPQPATGDRQPEAKTEPPTAVAAVEPVPLPKATGLAPQPAAQITDNREQRIENGQPTQAAEAVPPEVHPLFEKPRITAPGDRERRTENGERRHKLSKGVVAGLAALVFLVVGGIGMGLYLVKQQGVGEIRRGASSGCSIVDTDQGPGCWCANGGWQFHCFSEATRGTPPSDDCRNNCDALNLGGPQPTNPPPQLGCVAYDGPDCGGDGQGFCTRCPDGEGGRTEYFCKSPNVGVGGGCKAPTGTDQCTDNSQCPPGQVCQGAAGSRRCQVQGSTPPGTSCESNYIAFQCQQLMGGECHENSRDFPSDINSRQDAFNYANAWGCGQVDQVWNLTTNRNLCGEFAIFFEGCQGEQPMATPTPVTISANCQSLVPQMSDRAGGWVTKTDSEFSAQARQGDRVRFMCTGAKSSGMFTKSAFFINDVLYVDDVVKLNDTQFTVEYTIPAAGPLKVESVLLHDTKGWVD